jgi:hypothetical protein
VTETLTYYHGPPLPKHPLADVKWGMVLVVMAILHIVLIFSQTSPYVDICIVLVPIGQYFWPLVAFAVAVWTAGRAFSPRFGPPKRLRLIIAVLLALFAIDTITGGNYRWFELAMRYQISKVGGPTALQTWAQNELGTPAKIAALDQDAGGPLLASRTPRAYQHWFGHFGPMYRQSQGGGPAFQFDNGGWDMGWGVIVGRSDLKIVYPRGINGGNNYWTRQIQPGVLLYAFPF